MRSHLASTEPHPKVRLRLCIALMIYSIIDGLNDQNFSVAIQRRSSIKQALFQLKLPVHGALTEFDNYLGFS
jgi:hypothetical protein